MNESILFVDDDEFVLETYRRTFRKGYAVETAQGGEAGLAALANGGPFAVVVSDLRMPGMDGTQFLARAKERYPDTVRILLTGDADLWNAIEAVNSGNLFRFLTKPCPPAKLVAAVDAAVAQHRLITAERDLLDRTLRGAVRVLGEVLALVNTTAFGRADRTRRLIHDLAAVLPEAGRWEVDVAATLSQLGCVVVPENVLAAAERGDELSPAERKMIASHPTVARDLLAAIPRMETVSTIVWFQDQQYDGQNPEAPQGVEDQIPFGARVLKVVTDFDDLLVRQRTKPEAILEMKARPGFYDPAVLSALDELVQKEFPPERKDLAVHGLIAGMITAEDLYSDSGSLLLRRGSTLTPALILRLQNTAAQGGLSHMVPVLIPPAGV